MFLMQITGGNIPHVKICSLGEMSKIFLHPTRCLQNIFSERSLNFQNVKNKMRLVLECLSCTISGVSHIHFSAKASSNTIIIYKNAAEITRNHANLARRRLNEVSKNFSRLQYFYSASFYAVTGDDYSRNKRRP